MSNSSGGSGTGGMPMIGLGGSFGQGGDSGIDEECARSTEKAELIPANLLFVLDTSGSMNCNPPDGDAVLGERCARFPRKEDASRPSKWEVVRSALSTALGGLVGRPQLSAGLALFPSDDACGIGAAPSVPIELLDSAHLATIEASLEQVTPEGETPVAGATILSYAHLADALKKGSLSGNSFVILLTDGAETCAPQVLDQLVGTDVPNARLFDIRTFVIGAPGSESARSLLSRVAWEGGTSTSEDCDHAESATDVGDCHFDTTTTEDFETELASTLAAITKNQEIACILDVPQNPSGGAVDLDRVNVTFRPETGEAERILNDSKVSCAEGAEGWQYSEDRKRILLCGSACSRVRDASGELEIVLGCPTAVVP
jgi:hypothetical protein